METIKINHLSFSYPNNEEPVLRNIDFKVNAGEFVVLCGPSGCGKSTLLRQLKTSLTPYGQASGEIEICGINLKEMSFEAQSKEIGFVQQSPDDQIVTDKVWHELAFGLESLGKDTPFIRRRVAEMAAFFGIEDWFYKNVSELSGGQKQLLNLASVMAMQPSLLILDEPTSQLDPIAAADFLATLGRINRELGTTILLTEHRLEETFPLASRIAVMDKGTMLKVGSVEEVGRFLKDGGHGMFLAMPTAMRVWASVDSLSSCPVTVPEGRAFLENTEIKHKVIQSRNYDDNNPVILSATDLWFRYEKESPDVIRGLNFTLRKGDFVAIMGGNGAGKTTTLKCFADILKPYRGEVKKSETVTLLPQNPRTVFSKKTLRLDLQEGLDFSKKNEEESNRKLLHVISLCHLENLLDRHPFDLSGGEQQRAALAKVLLSRPEILLLDEPTKGLDAEFKLEFAEILKTLLASGISIIMVSHDMEFCAKYARKCCLFFDGQIVNEGNPVEFFSGNNFYTTSASRMSRDLIDGAVTPEDIIFALGGKSVEEQPLPPDIQIMPKPKKGSPEWKPTALTWWRKGLAAASLAIIAIVIIQTLGVTDLSKLVSSEGLSSLALDYLGSYAICIGAIIVFAFAVGRQSPPPLIVKTDKRSLTKRTLVASGIILIAMPVLLFIDDYYLGNKKYYFTMLCILLLSMVPYLMVFKERPVKISEVSCVVVMVIAATLSRLLFFMFPEFKPLVAIVIISGIAFGAENGFLVGSSTMLVSNLFFGQGPWTPWQMFAMGIVGFVAGVLFKKGVISRTRESLAIYGLIASIIIYGGIMNPATALTYAALKIINVKVLFQYYVTGFPVDCVRGIATAIFLWFFAEPVLDKLDRLKTKYGLME